VDGVTRAGLFRSILDDHWAAAVELPDCYLAIGATTDSSLSSLRFTSSG
jgi:hypothetical protein